MKKHSRLTALLLAVFLIISASACAGGSGGDESTQNETAGFAQTTPEPPQTTEEPSVTAGVGTDTGPPETTREPETLPPEAEDALRILMQAGEGEALTASFAEGERAVMLEKRAERMLRESLAAVLVSSSDDVVGQVENDIASGAGEYDLLLLTPGRGAELLIRGALEDLSEAGIGISPSTNGINKELTDDLGVFGGTYLISCRGLVSDLSSAQVIAYNGAPLSYDPLKSALAGNFTIETLVTYLAEIGDGTSLSLGSLSPLAVFGGAGGKVFTRSADGAPASALAEDPNFAAIFRSVTALTKGADKTQSSPFSLCLLGEAKKGTDIILPLPKLNATAKHATPLDPDSLSLLAAPAGVIDGRRLFSLLEAFNMASSDYRAEFGSSLAAEGAILSIIESSMTLDPGIILGWGDLDDLVSEKLIAGADPDTFLNDRVVIMQNKAAETAAAILADRLGAR